MIVYECRDYRISRFHDINPRRPYNVDHKRRGPDGRTNLDTVGWFETEYEAHRAKNRHAAENGIY